MRVPGRLWVAILVLILGTTAHVWLTRHGSWRVDAIAVLVVALPVLLSVPLAWGHPLARQWALLAAWSGMLATSGVGMTGVALGDPDGLWWFLAGVFGASLVTWGLSGERVRAHFSLHCESCGSYKTRSRSLFFNRVGCIRCGKEWPRGHSVDAAAFD